MRNSKGAVDCELSPRAEALRILNTGQEICCPDIPDLEPDSAEARQYYEDLKPLHYAGLAKTIDTVLETAGEGYVDLRENYPSPEPCDSKDEWQRLGDNIFDVTRKSILGVSKTQDYKETEKLTELLAMIEPKFKDFSLSVLLQRGTNTSISSSLTLLRNFPVIASKHGINISGRELEATARRSSALVRKMAKTCLNRLSAAQTALAASSEYESWSKIDKKLNPKLFKVKTTKNGPVLDYVDFREIKVPITDSHNNASSPNIKAVAAGSIACSKAAIVGCPITLLTGRLQENWNNNISLVQQQNLWRR